MLFFTACKEGQGAGSHSDLSFPLVSVISQALRMPPSISLGRSKVGGKVTVWRTKASRNRDWDQSEKKKIKNPTKTLSQPKSGLMLG